MDAASGGGSWTSATVGQPLAVNDRLRTGEDSRAAVRLTDLSVLRMDELTTITIGPPTTAGDKPALNVKEGTTYFFSREKSREIRVETPAANGAIRGTEFVVTVAANGSTTLTMLDGEVELSNAQGSLVVTSGRAGEGGRGRGAEENSGARSDQFRPVVSLLSGSSRSEGTRLLPRRECIDRRLQRGRFVWRRWRPTDIARDPARTRIRSITPVCFWRSAR